MAKSAHYLTPAELCERWDNAVSVGTLANWRSKRKGPAFNKFGSRVRYPLADVAAWEDENRHLVGANDNQETTNK